MILKTCFLLVLSAAWEVSGASFSKVFVQAGPEAAPAAEVVEYPYGIQTYSYPSPQIGQLTAAPVGFEYPLTSSFGYGIPCTISGCFYPDQTITSAASVAPSANIIEYASPVSNIPVAYSPVQNDHSGYEYAYVVVDQHTGDHKVHNELSDGGVVRGEYSFLQPDGNIREVTYVADDTKGFNAVVKNFLPVEVIKHTGIGQYILPANEVKSEAFTVLESHIEHQEPIVGHVEQARHGGPESNKEPAKETPEGQEVISGTVVENQESQVNSPDDLSKADEKDQAGHEEEIEKQTPENPKAPESHVTHENIIEIHRAVAHEPVPAGSQVHGIVESNVVVPSNDLIKCIQAAMANVYNNPSVPRPTSPLTYLVFNKP